MPLIEQIVREHLKFAYVTSIDRYIALGTYSGTESQYGNPGDVETVQGGLSYRDFENLLQSTNTSFLSLAQYWYVDKKMTDSRNTLPLRSLQHGRYVELLNTTILDF